MNIKRYCPRGHDKNVVGRTKDRKHCRQCERERIQRRNADIKAGRLTPRETDALMADIRRSNAAVEAENDALRRSR